MSVSHLRFKPLWWIYLVLYALLAVLGVALVAEGALSDQLDDFHAIDVWACLLSYIGLIPLVGYIRQRGYVNRHFWAGFLAVSLVSLPLAFFPGAWDLWMEERQAFQAEGGWPMMIGILVATFVLGLPAYWANFAYAFRSPHLWSASVLDRESGGLYAGGD